MRRIGSEDYFHIHVSIILRRSFRILTKVPTHIILLAFLRHCGNTHTMSSVHLHNCELSLHFFSSIVLSMENDDNVSLSESTCRSIDEYPVLRLPRITSQVTTDFQQLLEAIISHVRIVQTHCSTYGRPKYHWNPTLRCCSGSNCDNSEYSRACLHNALIEYRYNLTTQIQSVSTQCNHYHSKYQHFIISSSPRLLTSIILSFSSVLKCNACSSIPRRNYKLTRYSTFRYVDFFHS